MPNPEIEEFARLLIEHVRDQAIQHGDRWLHPENSDPVAIRWKKAAGDADSKSIAAVFIPDIVDSAIAQLLWAIDEGLLKLSFTASNGDSIDLSKEGFGELCGWYMGSDGWRAMYSKERYVDDFSDLK